VWARSLDPNHGYFHGLYSGREALRIGRDGGCRYAIFDDIQGGIKFFPGFKNWLGGQSQFQVKVMYKDPVLIDWGRPCIWLSNKDPRAEMDHEDVEWMEANCTFVNLDSTIFHARTAELLE